MAVTHTNTHNHEAIHSLPRSQHKLQWQRYDCQRQTVLSADIIHIETRLSCHILSIGVESEAAGYKLTMDL